MDLIKLSSDNDKLLTLYCRTMLLLTLYSVVDVVDLLVGVVSIDVDRLGIE